MAEILTPDCPFCHRSPQMVVGGTQAFCGNDECELLCWDPTLSLDENLMDAGVVKFPPPEGGLI